MQLFYVSGIQGNACILSDEESWHCTRVLRLGEGDRVSLTDGRGNMYEGIMTKVHHKGSLVEIVKTTHNCGRRNWHLQIAIAPTKNTDRFEWFLEKATEIGIDSITPLLCEHAERVVVKMPRLEKVLVAAMKQSLKAYLPELHQPGKFREIITADFTGQKFIAYCVTGKEGALHKVYRPGSDALVLIGPEGDFSQAEVELAKNHGFIPVNLGESRLRTETAGIVACHTINLLNNMAQ